MKALFAFIILCSSHIAMSQDYTVNVSTTAPWGELPPETSCFVCFPVFSTEEDQTYVTYTLYFAESPTEETSVSIWPQYPTDPEQEVCRVMNQLSPGTTYYVRVRVVGYSDYLSLVTNANPLFQVVVTAEHTTQELSTGTSGIYSEEIRFVNGELVGTRSQVVRAVNLLGQHIDPKGMLPPGSFVQLDDGRILRVPFRLL